MVSRVIVALFFLVQVTVAFQSKIVFGFSKIHQISKTSLNDIPLELTGKLDASKVWDVTLEFNGVSKVVSVSEGTSILDIAEVAFDGQSLTKRYDADISETSSRCGNIFSADLSVLIQFLLCKHWYACYNDSINGHL